MGKISFWLPATLFEYKWFYYLWWWYRRIYCSTIRYIDKFSESLIAQQSFSVKKINQIMKGFWNDMGSSRIITDATTYLNRLTPLQQENFILVQHSVQNEFTFQPSKEFFVRYHKWKTGKKMFQGMQIIKIGLRYLMNT